MGAALSSSDEHLGSPLVVSQPDQQQQQHHGAMWPLTARSGGRRTGAAVATHKDDDDSEPPQLLDADGSSSDTPDPATSNEEVRKALLLPATSACYVGRISRMTAGAGGDDSAAGQVVWAVPKSALLAPAGPSAAPSSGRDSSHPPSPALLLSPTSVLPGALVAAADGSSSTTTEWQLVLEPVAPAAESKDCTAHLSPSSPTPHNGNNKSSQDSSSACRVQVWRPSIRFVWSPSCSTQQNFPSSTDQTASVGAAAQTLGSSTPPRSEQGGSVSSSNSSSIASDSDGTAADVQMQEAAAVRTSAGGGSSKNGAQQVAESVTKSAEGVTKQQTDRKLLPSFWSIRKKNLAPASYRAAYQGQHSRNASTEAATDLAPHAGSTGVSLPSAASAGGAAASKAAGAQGSASGGSWQVACSGRLSFQCAGAERSASAAGFNLRLDQFGATWGAPFGICCQQTAPEAAIADASSSRGMGGSALGRSSGLQLLVLPAAAAQANTTAQGAVGPTTPCASTEADEFRIKVAFSQVQLLLTGSAAAAAGASGTAAAHIKGATTTAAAAKAAKGKSSSGSAGSNPHQQHPLGLSPPHTPTKHPEDVSSGARHSQRPSVSIDGSSGSSSQAVSTVVPGSSLPARQLEAVLLSHSPRMLVIDNFFSPEQCKGLMELARDRLVRSRVASGSETPSRTSWGHFFVRESARHPLILTAEAQIEALFNSAVLRGGYGPLAKVEAIQVVRYHKGEFYHEHYDNRADGPLTRAATILVYLCDTEEGGATSFSSAVTGFGRDPEADARVLPPKVTVGHGGRGVRVFPVQGRALVFWSKRPNGDEDPNSIHAAETVVEGEKWIATRWMKDDF